jgi:hypothetical protein
MSQRRNYGTLLLLSSLVLGVFLLTGSFIWMQDKANMILAVFVLILYGIGQWMTVVYWQRIQSDWEATGEVLGRLQQAVSDIPAALDSNLKSIASRLTEGQAQALSKLQAEVSDGARQTLEKGASLLADSLAKNLAAPLESMKGLLSGFAQQAEAQGEGIRKLAENQGDSLRKLAETQSESARSLGQEVLKTQREGAEQAKRLADGLSQELRSLAGSQSAQAQTLLSAWAERAATAQADSEARLQALQASLLQDVTAKLLAMRADQGAAQERALEKVLGGMESQSQAAQAALAAQSQALQAAAADQARTARASSEALEAARAETAAAFADGLNSLKETSLELVRDVEAKASATLEAQAQLGLEVAGKVSELADHIRQGSRDVAELSHVAQINQTEMQAGVAMLNSGLSSILERLEKQAAAGDGYQSLLAELGKTLADFQERSAEVLVENALKTQEILMEVLRHQEGRGAGSVREEAGETTLAAVP